MLEFQVNDTETLMKEEVPLHYLPDLAIEKFWIILAHNRPQLLYDSCPCQSADPLPPLLWLLTLFLEDSCGSSNHTPPS